MAWPVANFVGHRPAIRHPLCAGFGRAAAEAVELSCLARLLVPCPTSLKQCGKVIPQNQQRALSVAGRESCPFTHARGIFVDTEQAGDLFHRVAAVDFDLAVVGSAFGHGGYPPPLTQLP